MLGNLVFAFSFLFSSLGSEVPDHLNSLSSLVQTTNVEVERNKNITEEMRYEVEEFIRTSLNSKQCNLNHNGKANSSNGRIFYFKTGAISFSNEGREILRHAICIDFLA